MVVGVTGDSEQEVKEFIAKHEVGYPIVLAHPPGYEVSGIPHAFRIDPKGTILWTGHPGGLDDKLVQQALQGARRADGLVAALDTVQKEIEAEALGAAWQKAQELLAGGKLDDEATEQARELVARLEAEVLEGIARAEQQVVDQDWYGATVTLHRLQQHYQGVPKWEDAARRLQELRADRKLKREIDAGEKIQAARELDRQKRYDEAWKAYRAMAGSFAGTKAGRDATARQKEIETGGLLGFMRGCGACEGVGKACPRHKKK